MLKCKSCHEEHIIIYHKIQVHDEPGDPTEFECLDCAIHQLQSEHDYWQSLSARNSISKDIALKLLQEKGLLEEYERREKEYYELPF